jgi:hypothetical protein
VGDGVVVEATESPKRNKGKTGKTDSKRILLESGNDGDKTAKSAATSSLNEREAESFWHKYFDFRRYDFMSPPSLNYYLFKVCS